MTRLIGVALAMVLLCGLIRTVRADAPDTTATVDKAIKALGGEEKLGKAKIISWKLKTKFKFGDREIENTSQTTLQGLDHFRQVIEGEFNNMPFKAVTVLVEDKGVGNFGGMRMDLDKDAVATTKRAIYLTAIPMTLLPLKSKDFKLETIADEMVDGKPAVGIKVTTPDKKDFKLYFDKEGGLPVKMVATVRGFGPMGMEFTQELFFSDYKETGGIKKAMKIVAKRDGMQYMEQTITEFKVLDKVDDKTFTDPS